MRLLAVLLILAGLHAAKLTEAEEKELDRIRRERVVQSAKDAEIRLFEENQRTRCRGAAIDGSWIAFERRSRDGADASSLVFFDLKRRNRLEWDVPPSDRATNRLRRLLAEGGFLPDTVTVTSRKVGQFPSVQEGNGPRWTWEMRSSESAHVLTVRIERVTNALLFGRIAWEASREGVPAVSDVHPFDGGKGLALTISRITLGAAGRRGKEEELLAFHSGFLDPSETPTSGRDRGFEPPVPDRPWARWIERGWGGETRASNAMLWSGRRASAFPVAP